MKKFTMILFVVSFLNQSIIAQVDTVNKVSQPDIKNSDFYWKKAKTQKTIAWSMLGGGMATSIIGAIVWPDGYATGILTFFVTFGLAGEDVLPTPEEERKANLAGSLMITGVVIALGSTPFFILSSKNKRKTSVLLKQENVMLTPTLKSGYQLNQVGITIHFNP